MEKEYILGQLEKKLADHAYYKTASNESKIRASEEISLLIEQLADKTFKDKEKRLFFRAIDFVQKLQKVIR